MVLVDSLRPKDLSLYGCEKENDPYIKKIAGESLTFSKLFATSGGSDVSLTSIFSSQYPTTSGFMHQVPRMEDREIEKLKKNKFWFPKYLQKVGYNTISITPQHLWFKKGFDECMKREAEGVGKYLDVPWFRKILLSLPNWVYVTGKKMTKVRTSHTFTAADKIVDQTIQKINDVEKDKPFFMFLHLLDAHCPYAGVDVPNENFGKTFDEILGGCENDVQKEYVKKRMHDTGTGTLGQTKLKLDNSIKSVDKAIWKLWTYLEDNNLKEDTIFMILADHGENYGEHKNYFCRGGLYDESFHIPFIIYLPGVMGKMIDNLVSSIDIAPTVLDHLGEDKKEVDGKSLLPLAFGKEDHRDHVISVDGFCKDRMAIRTKDRKFILNKNPVCYLCGSKHSTKELEEFDLNLDKNELTNVFSEDSMLKDKLDNIRKEIFEELGKFESESKIMVNQEALGK